MKPIKTVLAVVCLAVIACTKTMAQTKQETVDWLKSKLVTYTLQGAGKALNVAFSSTNNELGIEYQDGSLVLNKLSKLNCSSISWVMDDNGPGTGSLQVTGEGTGSTKYDCFWSSTPIDDSVEIDFDDSKVWVVNPDSENTTRFCKQTDRAYAKFVFNSAFFTDPELKTRFEKALKHLVVLCGGNGSDAEPF
jgi:hypothetical protein